MDSKCLIWFSECSLQRKLKKKKKKQPGGRGSLDRVKTRFYPVSSLRRPLLFPLTYIAESFCVVIASIAHQMYIKLVATFSLSNSLLL